MKATRASLTALVRTPAQAAAAAVGAAGRERVRDPVAAADSRTDDEITARASHHCMLQPIAPDPTASVPTRAAPERLELPNVTQFHGRIPPAAEHFSGLGNDPPGSDRRTYCHPRTVENSLTRAGATSLS